MPRCERRHGDFTFCTFQHCLLPSRCAPFLFQWSATPSTVFYIVGQLYIICKILWWTSAGQHLRLPCCLGHHLALLLPTSERLCFLPIWLLVLFFLPGTIYRSVHGSRLAARHLSTPRADARTLTRRLKLHKISVEADICANSSTVDRVMMLLSSGASGSLNTTLYARDFSELFSF